MNEMKEQIINTKEIMEERELKNLCSDVKQCCSQHEFIKGEQMAALAMKHFRAALALDPTYEPASYNLEQYGTMTLEEKHCAFDEEDLGVKKMPSHASAKKQNANSTLRMILYPIYRNKDVNVSKNAG